MHFLPSKAWIFVQKEIKLQLEEMVGLGGCILNVSDVDYSLQEEYGLNFFFQDNKQMNK